PGPSNTSRSGTKSTTTTGAVAANHDRYAVRRAAMTPSSTTLMKIQTTSMTRAALRVPPVAADTTARATGYPGGKWVDGTCPSSATAARGENWSYQYVDG